MLTAKKRKKTTVKVGGAAIYSFSADGKMVFRSSFIPASSCLFEPKRPLPPLLPLTDTTKPLLMLCTDRMESCRRGMNLEPRLPSSGDSGRFLVTFFFFSPCSALIKVNPARHRRRLRGVCQRARTATVTLITVSRPAAAAAAAAWTCLSQRLPAF